MRFRFCGDLDCPDWVLLHIQLLSRLTASQLRDVVIEVVSILNSKENKSTTDDIDLDKVLNITASSQLLEEEVRACIAALDFIFVSAARYDTTPDVVSNELQQLGLPKEHSSSLCKVYSDNSTKLKESLSHKSLRINRLKQVSASPIRDKICGGGFQVNIPSVELTMTIESNCEKDRVEKLCLTEDSLLYMLKELEHCKEIMSNLK